MLKKYNYDVKMAFYTPLVSCLITEWPRVACKLYLSGRRLHANCNCVAASRMQISAHFIHVACDCRPRGYNLHATGGHLGTICMQLAATRVQFICDWPQVACKLCMRQRPVACNAASFLQPRCKNNYLNQKMKTPLKNLRIYTTHLLARSNTMHGPIQSRETVPLRNTTFFKLFQLNLFYS